MREGALPRRAFLGAGVRLDAGAIVVSRVLGPSALREGDVLLAIDGAPLPSLDALAVQLRAAAARDRVVLRVRREGELELTIPVAPMPREEIEGARVEYGHADWRGHRVRTIAVTPEAPIGTVLFLAGIYCQSIDLALAPEAPVAQLVRALAERGLATLRVERPGIGDSEGPPCAELDLRGELELYEAAASAIATRPLILFGHSLGGLLAALLAERADGLVVYGAPGASWTRTVRDGVERQLRLRGGSEAKIASALARYDADPFAERHGRALALHEQLDALDVPAIWRAVRAPVLVLIGEHDWVTGDPAQRAIAEHARATIVELAGLDHSFTTHASLEASLAAHGRGAFDPRIADETARFARALART